MKNHVRDAFQNASLLLDGLSWWTANAFCSAMYQHYKYSLIEIVCVSLTGGKISIASEMCDYLTTVCILYINPQTQIAYRKLCNRTP